jgi:hypothetical protein
MNLIPFGYLFELILMIFLLYALYLSLERFDIGTAHRLKPLFWTFPSFDFIIAVKFPTLVLLLSSYGKYIKIYNNFRHLCSIQTVTYHTLNTTCFGLSGPSSGASTNCPLSPKHVVLRVG